MRIDRAFRNCLKRQKTHSKEDSIIKAELKRERKELGKIRFVYLILTSNIHITTLMATNNASILATIITNKCSPKITTTIAIISILVKQTLFFFNADKTPS